MNNDNNNNQKANFTANNSASVGVNKEKEPVGTKESFLKEVGSEVEIPAEVQRSGVVPRTEKIEIPPDLKQIGLTQTGLATPVPFQPTLNLPITDEEIEKGLHASILTSLRWLAEWCLFQLKKAHLTLKVIKGIVRRVRI